MASFYVVSQFLILTYLTSIPGVGDEAVLNGGVGFSTKLSFSWVFYGRRRNFRTSYLTVYMSPLSVPKRPSSSFPPYETRRFWVMSSRLHPPLRHSAENNGFRTRTTKRISLKRICTRHPGDPDDTSPLIFPSLPYLSDQEDVPVESGTG